MTRYRVGFDVTSAVKRRGRGIASYVRALLPALQSAAPEIEPVLHVRGRRWFRRALIADLLPGAARRRLWGAPRADLEAFHGLGVRLPRRSAARFSFTLHDLRVFDTDAYDDPRWIGIRQRRVRESIARADAILCISEHGRSRLAHHFPEFPQESATVVPLGVDLEHFRPVPPDAAEEAVQRHGLERPFLLQVGRLAPHKNPQASLTGFAESQAGAAGLELVFIGGADPGYEEPVTALARKLGIAHQVRWLREVGYADLPAFYALAQAVLVPSHYEGFGLPVLEAMACGAAGIVANTTALPEVAGDAWPMAEADDSAGFARHIDRILIDPHFRSTCRERARQRAQEFSWERSARRTADFLLQK